MITRPSVGFLLVAAVVSVAAAPTPKPTPKPVPATPRQRPNLTFDVFFHELRSHGKWIQLQSGTKGLWVWRPAAVPNDWRPFGLGTWVYTQEGWYWLSDDPWGWATSHYGWWMWGDKGEWVWVPEGQVWTPAQAVWRQGEVALGWHPRIMVTDGKTYHQANDPFRMQGWTFLLWRNAPRAMIPQSGTDILPVKGRGQTAPAASGVNVLRALVVSSSTAVAATADLLSQTRIVSPLEAPTPQPGALLKNPGPDRTFVETKTGRKLAPCRIVESNEPGELLIVARDETVVLAFRPVLKERIEDIQLFIARQVERYRAMREGKAPKK